MDKMTGEENGMVPCACMTKRERFAMAAMQAMAYTARDSFEAAYDESKVPEIVAKAAVNCADALLKELAG